MTWQRRARAGVALVGVGFAVLLVAYSRDRAVQSLPVPAVETDAEASSESGPGTYTRLRGTAPEVTIEYERSQVYPDGRVRFEQAQATFESGQQIWADEIVATGRALSADEPSQYVLNGHVRLVENARLSIETDHATYDDVSGLVVMPNRVTFVRGPVTGSSAGATYDRVSNILRLVAEAEARVAAGADGTGGIDASAASMSLALDQNYLRLDRHARLDREFETLTADTLTIVFGDDGATVRFLEMRGHARVDPKPAGVSVMPSMAADDLTLSFYPDNVMLQHVTLAGDATLGLPSPDGQLAVAAAWIDLDLARDGATVTRLEGRDQVVVTLASNPSAAARTIHATHLTADGTDSAGLQSARFDGDVVFVEEWPGDDSDAARVRTATSNTLVLALDGGLDRIDQTEFRGALTFRAGEVTATAPIGRYDAGQGTLALRLDSDGQPDAPRVQNGRMTIAAEAIDISLTADELTARGGVSTVTESSGAVEDPARSLFGGTEPVYGTADVFEYAGATGRAVYRGSPDLPARLWQGGERVSADEIIIEDTSENLSAAGRVETLFATRPGPGATSGPETDDPIDYRIAAEAFAYEGATNRATYDGNPVTMTTRDGQTIAGHLVVQLSETSGTIEWFEATDDVFAELAGGHEAKGDTLTYEAVTGTYTLTGSPAQAKSPSADGTDCALTKGLRVVFAPGTGASWQDADGSLGQTKAINCRMSIR